MPKFWGNGYATEAARAVKSEGFRRGAKSIISLIHTGNVPSQKVAIRNGMMNEKNVTFKGFDLFVFRVVPDDEKLSQGVQR
jgi:RimJ/RimL family protein N-acetyltransferase